MNKNKFLNDLLKVVSVTTKVPIYDILFLIKDIESTKARCIFIVIAQKNYDLKHEEIAKFLNREKSTIYFFIRSRHKIFIKKENYKKDFENVLKLIQEKHHYQRITLNEIKEIVAERFGINVNYFNNPVHAKYIFIPRIVFFKVASDLEIYQKKEIAKSVKKEPAVLTYALNVLKNDFSLSKKLEPIIKEIKEKINQK